AAPMRDTDDRALDGEFAGSFPSGDGEAGGDLVATFTVFTPPTTFVVTAMDPEPDSILGVLPRTLTLTLSRDIDAATLADAVDLIASGGDGTFGNGNDLRLTPGLATVALSGADTIAITLNAFFPSLADTFRVTVRDTLEDTGAEALDGEFAGTLPSGDGTEGGDFDVEFEVRVLPKLTSIQANVFDVTCTQCHFGDPEFAPQGLSLDEEHAYDLLVGIASTEKPEYQRVESGNPDDSYLIRKLEGGPDILGTRMPQFGEALEPEVIAAIRQWITDGASR
ncbi:MAG: hypothetical protein KC466_17175, partial [Myxococcales bacterium]|nr:hypothetical protein [Myxococcales bacterium]